MYGAINNAFSYAVGDISKGEVLSLPAFLVS
jgi:hypothetical protein